MQPSDDNSRGTRDETLPDLDGKAPHLQTLKEMTGTETVLAENSDRRAPVRPIIREKIVWPPLKGTDIGNYVLLDEIGRGGMGIVYRAEQKGLDRIAAVKMILAGQQATQADTERFFCEAQVAAKLRHSNLVGVYEVGQQHGWHFIAMEYVEGRSLGDFIEATSMDATDAARLVAQIARAVAHLHANGIVHCDLKPDNILIDDEGTPYVTDFGLSRILDGPGYDLEEGTIAGSPGYMSPEQAEGLISETGPASDVYALGAILYHLLTGKPTFESRHLTEMLDSVIGRDPVPPRRIRREIPAGLELICMKCLEKSRERRYASAQALADDLERFLCGEPLEAQPLTAWRRLVRWARHDPALAGKTIGALVFYIVEMVWYYLLGISGPRFHYTVTAVVPLWIALSFVLHRLAARPDGKVAGRALWQMGDYLFLATILLASDQLVMTPIVICYPILVVGSGLYLRLRLVVLSTLLATGSYSLLWAWTCRIHPDNAGAYDRHIVFLIGLVLTGYLVTHLVRRIQVLGRRLNTLTP